MRGDNRDELDELLDWANEKRLLSWRDAHYLLDTWARKNMTRRQYLRYRMRVFLRMPKVWFRTLRDIRRVQ